MDIRILDNLLEELNTLPKHLIDNQFIAAGGLISHMAHELVDVKKGIADLVKRVKELEGGVANGED